MNNWERKSVAQHCSTSSSDAKYCSSTDVSRPIHGRGRGTTEGSSEADKVADGGDDVDVGGRGADGGENLVKLAPELGGRVELVVDALHAAWMGIGAGYGARWRAAWVWLRAVATVAASEEGGRCYVVGGLVERQAINQVGAACWVRVEMPVKRCYYVRHVVLPNLRVNPGHFAARADQSIINRSFETHGACSKCRDPATTSCGRVVRKGGFARCMICQLDREADLM
jgi:hypothetical protein